MPYPNEHAARQTDPKLYAELRRENDKFGKGIHVIWGVVSNSTSDVQSIRFDAARFSPEEAIKWLEKNKYETNIEKATGIDASLTLDKGQSFQPIAAAKSSEGIPTRRYRKEVIQTGTYVKEDMEFEVTAETLSNWVKQFRRMKKNGVKVPIPTSHENDGDSEENRGWVLDLFVENQSLFMVCELIGDDAMQTASRADVSLFSPPTFKDGKGNEYLRPITHVAMTTHPVVPGLSEFIPIAASLKKKETNKMDLAKLGKALSLELTEKEAETQITAAFSQLSADLKSEKEKREAVEKERDAAKKDLELFGNKPAEPDATLVSLAADNRGMKLNQLVEAGRITPAVRDKLESLYVGKDNAALVLSLKAGTQGQFDELVLALTENDPVKLKESTGPQTMKLADDRKGETGTNPLIADAERRAKAGATA